MRIGALLLAAALLPASVPPVHAEIAVMESGKILYIDSYQREDKLITLFLSGGGLARIPAELVANIVPNEIVPEGEIEPTALPLIPQFGGIINPAARRWGLDPRLVAAVVWVESSGDPKAISRKGAQGLMQLMPATARDLGVEDSLDPAQNVEGGTRSDSVAAAELARHRGPLGGQVQPGPPHCIRCDERRQGGERPGQLASRLQQGPVAGNFRRVRGRGGG